MPNTSSKNNHLNELKSSSIDLLSKEEQESSVRKITPLFFHCKTYRKDEKN